MFCIPPKHFSTLNKSVWWPQHYSLCIVNRNTMYFIMSNKFVASCQVSTSTLWQLYTLINKSIEHGVFFCCFIGLPHFYNLQEVTENAVRICKASHADPLCIASAVSMAVIVAFMLQVRWRDIQEHKLFGFF